MKLPASWIVAATLVTGACGAPATGPGGRPAATADTAGAALVIDGRAIPSSHFDAYVAANLDTEGLEEPLAAEDEERVKSRLFDDFVAEETLLAEAEIRGIRAGEAEIHSWISGDGPEEDAAKVALRLERARRELITRKLLDALMLEHPGEDEFMLRREVARSHRIESRPGNLPFTYRPETP